MRRGSNIGLVSRAFVRVVYGGLPEASNAEAIANFKKAIALAPDRIIHHAGLAMAYEATGDRQSEIAELKKCRDLKPTGLEDEDAQRDAIKKLAALETINLNLKFEPTKSKKCKAPTRTFQSCRSRR